MQILPRCGRNETVRGFTEVWHAVVDAGSKEREPTLTERTKRIWDELWIEMEMVTKRSHGLNPPEHRIMPGIYLAEEVVDGQAGDEVN